MAAEGGTLNVGIKVCEEPVEETKTAGITGLNTCPTDPRFQQQNKTSWCYTMFIDFHRCLAYLIIPYTIVSYALRHNKLGTVVPNSFK